MSEIRKMLVKPYFAAEEKHVPFWDFNREIVAPGTDDNFPDGAVGIRVDQDFWSVAALPYSLLDWKIEDIVKDLWPGVNPTFWPDAGTLEQRVAFLEAEVECYEKMEAYYFGEISKYKRLISHQADRPILGKAKE